MWCAGLLSSSHFCHHTSALISRLVVRVATTPSLFRPYQVLRLVFPATDMLSFRQRVQARIRTGSIVADGNRNRRRVKGCRTAARVKFFEGPRVRKHMVPQRILRVVHTTSGVVF